MEAAGIARSHTKGGILAGMAGDMNVGDAGRSGSSLGCEREEVVGMIAWDETVEGMDWDAGGRREFLLLLSF